MAKGRTDFLLLLTLALALPSTGQAMHISEGILPPKWAALWYAIAIFFVAWGLRDLRVKSAREPFFKPMVGLIGAAVFVISCMPIPVPIAGTCSHPCGTGMAAILIGPTLSVVVSSVALLLQALFLAHGGLTTLGGNIVSMGIAGAFTGWAVFRLSRRAGLSPWAAAFLCGMFSDWATYAATSFELASALHGNSSFLHMFAAIGASFLPTQLPLGIFEGVVTAGVYRFIAVRRPSLLECLGVEARRCPLVPQKTGGAK
ncbi:MAG: energy-coupling factor ABC transporter permease [Verrucomicrobia bacterium]|nr:energy-coupling factor ABC transporter permease [Verrucomicrobiota bacterium]